MQNSGETTDRWSLLRRQRWHVLIIRSMEKSKQLLFYILTNLSVSEAPEEKKSQPNQYRQILKWLNIIIVCLFLFCFVCCFLLLFFTYIHIYFDDITLYMNTRFFICIISLSQIIPLFNFCIRSFHRRKYELSLISGDYLVNDLTTDFVRYLYVIKCMVIDVWWLS